jgi:hypothetical protein
MVAMPSGAVYPSHQGLIYLNANRVPVVLSAQHYAPSDWQALHPDTMLGAYHEGRLFLFFRNGAFCLAVREGAGTAAETEHHTELSLRPNDAFVSRLGRFYLRQGDQLLEWNRGDTLLPHRFEGGTIAVGTDFNFGVLHIVATGGEEHVEYFVDGHSELSENATQPERFALPLWATGTEFRWVLTGTAQVTRLALAPSMNEL